MKQNLLAIRNAVAMVGKTSEVEEQKSSVLPTAGTRSALDLLTHSTPDELLANEVSLREVAIKLFNWGGQNRASKNVIRALNTCLNTPGKYSHAVELIAFVAAVAPHFEPDRIARLLTVVDEVETSFGPARYTMQLSRRLAPILEPFNEDRQEKIIRSLWVQSHKGRWWDLTTGGITVQPVAVPVDATTALSNTEVMESFIKGELAYSEAHAEEMKRIPINEDVANTLREYNKKRLEGLIVDPDVALLASYIPWLTPEVRPESPVGNLVDTVVQITEALPDYSFPEKPRSFSDLFPNVRLYGQHHFPFSPITLASDGYQLLPGVSLEIVRSSAALAENRDYMGNCTWSYKSRMEEGTYVLYRVINGDEIYNASMIRQGQAWKLGELNSRYNRGDVPADVYAAMEKFIKNMPVDPATDALVHAYKEAEGRLQKKYVLNL